MEQMNIHQAKTHLSKALARVQAGETLIIANNGRPVAQLVPFKPRRSGSRPFGTGKSLIRLKAGWDAPLPAKILKAFES